MCYQPVKAKAWQSGHNIDIFDGFKRSEHNKTLDRRRVLGCKPVEKR
jgi:hypothetical protein